MTLEEMQEVANDVCEALRKAGFENVIYLDEDHLPGEPLPIMFERNDETFGIDLSVA